MLQRHLENYPLKNAISCEWFPSHPSQPHAHTRIIWNAKHSKAFWCNKRYMHMWIVEYCQVCSHIKIYVSISVANIKVEGLEIFANNHQAAKLLAATTARLRFAVCIHCYIYNYIYMYECACVYLNTASNLNWWHTPKACVVHLRLSEVFVYRLSCSAKVLLLRPFKLHTYTHTSQIHICICV